MNRITERVERDLRHIADRATPSRTAWEAIQTRVAEQVDVPETEIIMLDENTTPPRRRRTAVWIISAAAALVVMVAGVVALTRSDADPQPIESASDEASPDYSTIGDVEEEAIERFVAAINAGDVNAVVSGFGPQAEFGSPMLNTPSDVTAVAELEGTVDEFFRFLTDRGVEISISTCEPHSGGQVRCLGSYSDDVVARVDGYVSGSAEGYTLRILFAADDGGLSHLTLNPTLPRGVVGGYAEGFCRNPCNPTPWVTSSGYLAFLDWIDSTHPRERALLMDDSMAYPTRDDPAEDDFVYGAFPNFTPDSRALWSSRVAEWLATLD